MTQDTADNIALCGGGLELERRTGLSSAINVATNTGSISARSSRRLEAAFLAEFSDTPEDAEWLFERYIACVTGEENLQSLIEDIRRDGIATRSRLVSSGASDDRIDSLMAFRRDEIAALERREYVQARRLKRAFFNGVLETVLSPSDAEAVSGILEARAAPQTVRRPLFNFPIPGAAPPGSDIATAAAAPGLASRPAREAIEFCESEYSASDCDRLLARALD